VHIAIEEPSRNWQKLLPAIPLMPWGHLSGMAFFESERVDLHVRAKNQERGGPTAIRVQLRLAFL
jgi:hypothetical protein